MPDGHRIYRIYDSAPVGFGPNKMTRRGNAGHRFETERLECGASSAGRLPMGRQIQNIHSFTDSSPPKAARNARGRWLAQPGSGERLKSGEVSFLGGPTDAKLGSEQKVLQNSSDQKRPRVLQFIFLLSESCSGPTVLSAKLLVYEFSHQPSTKTCEATVHDS